MLEDIIFEVIETEIKTATLKNNDLDMVRLIMVPVVTSELNNSSS